jgi:hypothetical protein
LALLSLGVPLEPADCRRFLVTNASRAPSEQVEMVMHATVAAGEIQGTTTRDANEALVQRIKQSEKSGRTVA